MHELADSPHASNVRATQTRERACDKGGLTHELKKTAARSRCHRSDGDLRPSEPREPLVPLRRSAGVRNLLGRGAGDWWPSRRIRPVDAKEVEYLGEHP